jgi:hypothetical protein
MFYSAEFPYIKFHDVQSFTVILLGWIVWNQILPTAIQPKVTARFFKVFIFRQKSLSFWSPLLCKSTGNVWVGQIFEFVEFIGAMLSPYF